MTNHLIASNTIDAEKIFLLRPIDIVRCFHNAFRRDMSQIDTSMLNIAREGGDLALIFDRLQIVTEILDYHARGEEAAVFPAVGQHRASCSQSLHYGSS